MGYMAAGTARSAKTPSSPANIAMPVKAMPETLTPAMPPAPKPAPLNNETKRHGVAWRRLLVANQNAMATRPGACAPGCGALSSMITA